MSTSSWQSSTDSCWCSPSRRHVHESNHGGIPTRIGTSFGHHCFTICHDWFGEVPLEHWQQMLPPRLQWPVPVTRVEDGGGLPSTAFHMTKCMADRLVKLRSQWFKRLSDTKHCLKITAALISGCREPPLSQQELQPYVEDLWTVLSAPQVTTCFTFLRASLSDFTSGIAWQHFWVILALIFFSV